MPVRTTTLVLLNVFAALSAARAEAPVSFKHDDSRVQIDVDGRSFATYVYRDPDILRPYLTHVHAPSGTQVTRNHPPVPGRDAVDHDTMHPGIWLAFGDLSGADFWRNKARVEHIEFVETPVADDEGGHFAVRNRYVADGATMCEELCRIAVRKLPAGTLILWDSTFTGPREFAFGDQEEMGLGVRVATPLAAKNGGRLTNADGLVGEDQVWGKQAAWCDYSGTINGEALGVLLVPDPQNFRRAWFHARDYGFVAANPFGRNAFTRGEKSRVSVEPEKSLRLRFGVLVHSGPIDLQSAYHDVAAALAGGQ
ncbi:MAG: hypothetical protein DWQ37_18925 [Planctomycetota bacterium]|nr:MAG: hypothetical protein DWQ37_18925 [Planctomycetota bacterium]